MKITRLSVERFRSYERLDLPLPDAHVQLFTGPNGSGKTNIVEAISFLSLGRSCLRALQEDVVRFGEDFFRVRADVLCENEKTKTLEYVWQRLPRRQSATFIDDVRTPLLGFIGVLPTVTFLPEDLSLFSGPPAKRRAFLDILLSQLESPYAGLRLEYERILKQRAALLRRIADRVSLQSELDLWDERLAEAGARLTERRATLVTRFNAGISDAIRTLGEKPREGVLLVYERSSTGSDARSIASEILSSLRAARDRDILLLSTSTGPHRDDWHIVQDSKAIERFTSRGQQRSYLVALVLQSASILGDTRKERPVILLDDVLSELDDRHQEALLTSLRSHQVLVTSAHEVQKKNLVVWRVGKGKVERAK